MLQLRPYQTDAINQMRTLMQQGCKSILYTAPTGSGKTALTAHMLHTAASKGMRSLFVVHRRELIKQSIDAFNKQGLDHGIIAAGFEEDRSHRVQLASVQTLARRISRYSEPSLVVWDESHHLAARSWSSIFGRFTNSYHIGLTATPERLDGQGLGTYFKQMVCGPSVSSLTQQGYLSPYKLYAPSNVDLTGVHTRMGDYVRAELETVMDKPAIMGDVIAHYRKYADKKKTLIFCPTVKHSKHVSEQFCAAGYRAMHVDGETEPEVRDNAMQRFGNGYLDILTSVDIFGEGVDVPALECVVLLRATQSHGLFLQQCGRSLRPFAGKREAIILDHVGNTLRHGLPDTDHTWTLEGHAGRTRSTTSQVSVKICPSCFATQPAGVPACKFCGTVFPVKPREIRQTEGELQEIKAEIARKQVRQQQGMAQSMEELYRIGIERGYKNARAWAYFVFKGRQQKRNRGQVA